MMMNKESPYTLQSQGEISFAIERVTALANDTH